MQKDKTEEVHYMVERVAPDCYKTIQASMDKRGYLVKKDLAIYFSETAAELSIRDLVDKKERIRRQEIEKKSQERKKAAKELTKLENVVN